MLKNGDLEYVLKPYVEVGMYEPKSGSLDEVTVINFYMTEEDALKDIKTFFNYMPLKNFIDITTSNYVDDDGNYIIFIELSKSNTTFDDLLRMIFELGSISNIEDWKVKIYKNKPLSIGIDKIKEHFAK